MLDAKVGSRRVVMVVAGGEEADSPVPGLLGGLLAAGCDVHVLYEGGDPSRIPGLDTLPEHVLRTRVHPPPVLLRRRGPRPGLRRGLARAFWRRPLATARQLGPRVPPLDRYLRAVVLALHPDVVHVPTASSVERWSEVMALCGARLVVSLSGEELALGPDHPESWSPLWRTAGGIVVETATGAELARRLGAPDEALAVVAPAPDGPPLRPELPHRERHRPLRILSAGDLSWTQGLEYSMRAVKLLADEGIACEYRIVGAGDFVDALGFARHQLGVEQIVDLAAPSSNGLRDHLQWADVLVNAAVVPTSLRTSVSALALGLPVVTTAAPPGAENAVLGVPRRDPEAIAARLAALARDSDTWARLSRAGRAWAAAGRGTEGQAQELLALYGTLV